MQPSSHDRHFATNILAPGLMLAGVAIILLAQLWPALPMAGAVALVAWGSAAAVNHRPTRLVLVTVVYGSLVLLAIAAQLDVAEKSGSLLRQFLVAMDAGAAGAIQFLIAKRTVAALK